MKRLFCGAVLLFGWLVANGAPLHGPGSHQSQDATKQTQPAQDAAPPAATAARTRLTIDVTGGTNNVSIIDASVYLKYVEVRKIGKDKKYALNVKTNRDGKAHIPDPPMGRVLIQVVAEGWKSYGQYYELTDPGTVIKIHLERPPKWY